MSPRNLVRCFEALSSLALVSLLLASGCHQECPACQRTAPAPKPPTPTPATSTETKDWLVQDFETDGGKSGPIWLEFDRSGIGTRVEQERFVVTPGDATSASGGAAHLKGVLGANRAPWSWVQLQMFLNPSKSTVELGKYKSVRFFVKGDGGRYLVTLVKTSVKDYDHYRYQFTAPEQWTEVRVPLSAFRQGGWGKPVPATLEDVQQLQFSPAEYEKPFDVYFDNVVLSTEPVSMEPVAYDTKDWFGWPGTDPAKRKGTPLDVSRLLDAPAGKHGPLGHQGEQFVFRDGTRAKFWGINLVGSANFPTHEEADRMADLLAQMGVNMTRHHHIDAAWSNPNVFGNKDRTTDLDAVAMERFDYLVSALQKRGIYQFFDMLVHRKVTPADGVPDSDKLAAGLKIEGEFDPALIALQERFVQSFMGHRNSYLGTTYAKSAGIAMVEVINEDSLFWLQPEGEFSVKTASHRQKLNELFGKWLAKEVPGGRAALEQRWKSSDVADALLWEEDPSKGTVDALRPFRAAGASSKASARSRDTLRFLYDTELGYYRRFEKVLRALGYQGQLTGSNHWTMHPLDLKANSELNFVDRHAYFAHPEGGWGYNANINWNPSAMVKDPNLGIVGSLAQRRVKGVPYTASEWQTCAPNDYRHEGLLLVGAYASLQQLSPLQFAFSHDRSNRPEIPKAISTNFDVIGQPTMLGAWPAVSLLFHRGDVTPSDVDATAKVDPWSDSAQYPNAQLGLIAKTGVDFGGASGAKTTEAELRAKYVQGSVVSSTTGQLRHNAAAGTFELDTPRSQGFVGFRTPSPTKLSNVLVEIDNPFAVVVVTSLDNQSIDKSKHLLVTALGNSVNTAMTLEPGRNRLHSPGTEPVLVEPIRGRVEFQNLSSAIDQAKAFALDANGQRATEVSLQKRAGGLNLPLSAAAKTMHYEVVIP